jgi:hypothetical protein
VFLSADGKVFMPTARHIWDQLLTNDLSLDEKIYSGVSSVIGEKLTSVAEEVGQDIFNSMQEAHVLAVAREEERGTTAFTSRRKSINRLGLPEVRQFRMARLDEDEAQWRSELQSARQIVPELRPLMMMKVQKCKGAGVQR